MPDNWKTRMRLYGEQARDAHPTVASVWTGRIFPNSIEIVWRKGNKSTAVIEYGKPGGPVLGTAKEAGEEGWAVIPNLQSDTIYQFRLIAATQHGYKYFSPWYLVRTRAQDGTLGTVESMQSFGIFDPYFLPVADAPLADPPKPPSQAEGKMVAVIDAGFESGTKGWKLTKGLERKASRGNDKLKPQQGKHMFGWIRIPKGKRDNEIYRKDYATQTVSVKPGTWYELSAWALTAEPDWPKEKWIQGTWAYPFFGGRCRNRISLVTDASGGQDFTATNSTQWFSTKGKWMLLKKAFKAETSKVTIGAGFYQRGERDWDAAFVDDFQLTELDKTPF
jgi:hypothetical protein